MDRITHGLLLLGIGIDSNDWRSMLQTLRAERNTPLKGVRLLDAAIALAKRPESTSKALAIELVREMRATCWRGIGQVGIAGEVYLIEALLNWRNLKKDRQEARQRYEDLEEIAGRGNRYAQKAIKQLAPKFN